MKYAFSIVLMLSLLLINSKAIFAAEDRQPKTVSGKVRYADLAVGKDLPVSVTCKSTTITDTTSVNGNYSVTFGNLECEQFDTAVVIVETDTHYGSGTREITFALGQALPDIILNEISSESPTPTGEVPMPVPEFGTLSAIMAGSVSLLTYARMRKTIV